MVELIKNSNDLPSPQRLERQREKMVLPEPSAEGRVGGGRAQGAEVGPPASTAEGGPSRQNQEGHTDSA